MSVLLKNDQSPLPIVLNQLILTYLRYADYSDEEILKLFPISVVLFWRKEANAKDGMINGVNHSVDDLPIITNNVQIWYRDGKVHRDGDKPAYINGLHQEWCKNDFCHRENDLPAYIDGDYKAWYKNGIWIRDN